MTITNEQLTLYSIDNIIKNKTYRVNFKIDGNFKMQFVVIPEETSLQRPLMAPKQLIAASYSYSIKSPITGKLYFKDLSDSSLKPVNWTQIDNLIVEEL